jgi:hypothetical protein
MQQKVPTNHGMNARASLITNSAKRNDHTLEKFKLLTKLLPDILKDIPIVYFA